jgi:ATP synthase protein I
VGTPEKQRRELPPIFRVAMMALSIPMLMLAGPVIGFLIGRWIDGRMDWAPWGAIVGLVLGLVTGFHESFLIIRRLWRLQK